MTKKKKKRSNLKPSDNTKVRQIYMDNHHYVSKLTDEAKEFLEKFNGEYYGASFSDAWEYDEVHQIRVDKETVEDIKNQIKAHIKAFNKICSKSPNTTTEDDREEARRLQEQIENMEAFLNEVHPRRELEQANYRRMTDIMNHARVSNEFKVASWEELREDELNSVRKWEDDEE